MARQRKEENIIGALGEAYHRALPSQEIKRFIKEGMIVTGEALPPEQAIKKVMKDERLQPSTYEPMLSDELFIIDDNVKGGAFNPRLGEQIYHTILNLPLNARHRVSITSNGFEIKPGKSYLVKLEDKLFLHKGLEEGWAWATPKSGQGRLFNQNRLLADNMGAHDEVPGIIPGESGDLWLLVEPEVTSIIIRPGDRLNQIRFFEGYNYRLNTNTIEEIFKRADKPALMSAPDGHGGWVPVNPKAYFTGDGLKMTLDLIGERTESIVAFRMRRNASEPIDLQRKGYDPADFYEALTKNDLEMIRGSRWPEHLLLCSKEKLQTPDDVCMTVDTYSDKTFEGKKHRAGAINNEYKGVIVFEVASTEMSNKSIYDGMHITTVHLHYTGVADIKYKKSTFQGAEELRLPKQFKKLGKMDLEELAVKYDTLKGSVLVMDRKRIIDFRHANEGFEPLTPDKEKALYERVDDGFFELKTEAEKDDLTAQFSTYIIIADRQGRVFSYRREVDLEKSGEKELHGKYSIGVGGHIRKDDKEIKKDDGEQTERVDGRACLLRGALRKRDKEVRNEGSYGMLNPTDARYGQLIPLGTIYATDEHVDERHVGIVYLSITDGKITPGTDKDRSVAAGKMRTIDQLLQEAAELPYETWSRVLIPHLQDILEQYR